MTARQHARDIAFHLDRKIGGGVVRKYVEGRDDLECPITFERRMDALRRTVERLVPDHAARLRPKNRIQNTRLAAMLLIRVAGAMMDDDGLSVIRTNISPPRSDYVIRTVGEYLDALVGASPREPDETLLRIRPLIRLINSRIGADLARWGWLMSKPRHLLAVAGALKRTPEAKRGELMLEIMSALVFFQDRPPTTEQACAVIESIVKKRAGP